MLVPVGNMGEGNVSTVVQVGSIYVFVFHLRLTLTLSWEGTKGSQRPPKKTSRGGGLAVNGNNLT